MLYFLKNNFFLILKIFFTFLIYLCLGITVLKSKHNVMLLEKDENKLKVKIADLKDELHVLKAEWYFLNNPKKIKKLTHKFLKNIIPPTINSSKNI